VLASRPAAFVIDAPGAWRAQSFHAEIAIPEELHVEDAVLVDFDDDEPLSKFDSDVNRAALYASEPLDRMEPPRGRWRPVVG
jgi:hypothetical protein